jgi:hypothetical protein
VVVAVVMLGMWGQGGRMCVAMAVGDSPPRGLILGTGAGVVYVEPPAAVPLNNELGAARAEAAAAEEAVLWGLTGQVADAEETLQRALDAVNTRHLMLLFCYCVDPFCI